MKINAILYSPIKNLKPKFNPSSRFSDCRAIDAKLCDTVSFSKSSQRNYGRTLKSAVSGIEKSMDSGDFRKAGKILKSFYEQNGGKDNFYEQYSEKMNSTCLSSLPQLYTHRYPTGRNSDMLMNKDSLAYRKGSEIVKLDFETGQTCSEHDDVFAAYDLIRDVSEQFELGNNDACADLMIEFYNKYKDSELQDSTCFADEGNLTMEGKYKSCAKVEIELKPIKNTEYDSDNTTMKRKISLNIDKKDNIISYSTENSKPDGFFCFRTYSYDY